MPYRTAIPDEARNAVSVRFTNTQRSFLESLPRGTMGDFIRASLDAAIERHNSPDRKILEELQECLKQSQALVEELSH